MEVRKGKPSITVALVALCLGLSAIPPAQSDSAAQTTLAGITTVTFQGSGRTTVDLPVEATFSTQRESNPHIAVSGTDGYASLILVADEEDLAGPMLLVSRLPLDAFCVDGGCPLGQITPIWSRLMTAENATGGPVVLIPPGRYHLYAIAESFSETRIEVRFDGLDGDAAITLTEPLDAVLSVRSPNVTDAGPILLWGGTHDVGVQRGIAMTFAWLRSPIDPEGVFEYCVFNNGPHDGIPGCPTATTIFRGQYTTPLYNFPALSLFEGYVLPFNDVQGQQITWLSARLTESVGAVMMWVPLGEAAAPHTRGERAVRWTRWDHSGSGLAVESRKLPLQPSVAGG